MQKVAMIHIHFKQSLKLRPSALNLNHFQYTLPPLDLVPFGRFKSSADTSDEDRIFFDMKRMKIWLKFIVLKAIVYKTISFSATSTTSEWNQNCMKLPNVIAFAWISMKVHTTCADK